MLGGHGRADRAGHLADIHLASLPGDLMRDHQPLLIAAGHGEGRRAAPTQHRAASLRGQLDVLRVMVAAADDDQVLDPARDDQLAA